MDFPGLVAASGVEFGKGNPSFALCPFHGESTPSFAIYVDHGHCFGCGWHGDAISWLRDREGLDFRSAALQAAEIGLARPEALSFLEALNRGGRRNNEKRETPERQKDDEREPELASKLYDAAIRIGVGTGARKALIEQRRMWCPETPIPKECKRLAIKEAKRLGIETPRDAIGVIVYAYMRGGRTVGAVAMEAVNRDGIVLQWGKKKRIETVLADDPTNSTFMVRGFGHGLVLCDTPATAMVARWLHPGFTTAAFPNGESPPDSFAASYDPILAEGSSEWLSDGRLGSIWSKVDRANGGLPEDDLNWIARIRFDDVVERIDAVGDYRKLAPGSVEIDNWPEEDFAASNVLVDTSHLELDAGDQGNDGLRSSGVK